jgi:hypothetical protein
MSQFIYSSAESHSAECHGALVHLPLPSSHQQDRWFHCEHTHKALKHLSSLKYCLQQLFYFKHLIRNHINKNHFYGFIESKDIVAYFVFSASDSSA